jgi:hypothetical protein
MIGAIEIMGIASVDSVVPKETPDPNDPNMKKETTPTYLSGESLTFPLVTAVGSAALTVIIALGRQPTPWTALIIAIVCGALVTIWGFVDAKAAGGRSYSAGVWFKLIVTGALNTVLLTTALLGSLGVIQQAAQTLNP